MHRVGLGFITRPWSSLRLAKSDGVVSFGDTAEDANGRGILLITNVETIVWTSQVLTTESAMRTVAVDLKKSSAHEPIY